MAEALTTENTVHGVLLTSAALLMLLRGRSTPAAVPPSPPTTTEVALRKLTRLTSSLVKKYQHIRPELVQQIQNDILHRVTTDKLTPEMGLIGLNVLLATERRSANEVAFHLAEEHVVGTLKEWYIEQHTLPNSIDSSEEDNCFWGSVYGKEGVADGSLLHTDGGVRIGDFVFTDNGKMYKLGIEKNSDRPGGRKKKQQGRGRGRGRGHRNSIERERSALKRSFRLRRNSTTAGGGASSSHLDDDDEDSSSSDDDDATQSEYRSYLFGHLKAEVIVLNKLGLVFIKREVDQMSMYTSDDPMRGFREAHQVIKRVVVSHQPNQIPGEQWNLGNSYEEFIASIPPHSMSSLWDAMRRMVIWFDNFPTNQKSTVTEHELMKNLPHIILIARHTKVSMGIRSLLRNSRVAASPSQRASMRRQASQLSMRHGQEVQQSDSILRRIDSSAASLVASKSSRNMRGGNRRRRPSMDDSSVRLYRETESLKIHVVSGTERQSIR